MPLFIYIPVIGFMTWRAFDNGIAPLYYFLFLADGS